MSDQLEGVTRRGALAFLSAAGIGGAWWLDTSPEDTGESVANAATVPETPLATNPDVDGWVFWRGKCADEFNEPLKIMFVAGSAEVDPYVTTVNFSEGFSPELEKGEYYQIRVIDAEGDERLVGSLRYSGQTEAIILSTCS